MPEPDLVKLFVQPLDQLDVRYLVSGSVAAMLYGEPRVTHDIDLVVFLGSAEVRNSALFFQRRLFMFHHWKPFFSR
jgi:hypothetical protein